MGLGMNFFFGPIVSALCSRYGCRAVAMTGGVLSVVAMLSTSFVNSLVPMYLTYSLLWGLGSSMCYVPTFLIVDKYFPRRKALANGIITAGSAIGALILGPTMNALLKSIGWRYTMRVLSGVACLLLVGATTYKPVAEGCVDEHRMDKKKKLFDISVWKNRGFIVWAVALALFNLGYFVPYVFLVSEQQGRARTQGIMGRANVFPPVHDSSCALESSHRLLLSCQFRIFLCFNRCSYSL